MRKILAGEFNKSIFILCIGLFAFNQLSFSQCTVGAGYTNDGTLTPTTSWQTLSNTGGRHYRSFSATLGNIYEFSYCAAFGGGSSGFDTQITIVDNTNTVVAYNDNSCGNQSYISWLCPASGTYRVIYTKKTCTTQNGLGTLAYRFTTPTCPGNLGTGVTNVASLPYSSGAGSTSGKVNDLTSANVTSCGNSSYLGGEDAVWVFTPAATGYLTIALTSANNNNGLKLYAGCPLLGQGGTCVANTTGNNSISLSTCVTSGVTYYLVLDVFPNPTPTFSTYSNLTISAPGPSPCNLGTGVVNVASLPYTSNGRTTCGKVNDITSANTASCGISNYFGGEDEVFIFTPASSGNITVTLTSSGSRTGLMLYDNCPLSASCTPANCLANEQSTSGNKSLCANVVAGTTYYLIVDSWPNPACNGYNITIDAPSGSLPGSVCANAINIPSLPFAVSNETTKCRGNDYTNASIGSCGTAYESGEDKVYVYNATGAECLGVTITGANSNSIGFQVYKGCPGDVGTTCIGNVGGASNGTLSGTVILTSAGTYYFVIDNQAAPSFVNYNLSIATFGAGAGNDLPCFATPIGLGTAFIGSNTCSGSSGEPTTLPGCWHPGTNPRNTVWYSVTAPLSGKLRIRAIPYSLTNPQIAVYSGDCNAAASMTLRGCSDDTSGCGSTTNYSSDIYLSGLTFGNTYYIAVDGYGTLTGTFGILAIDGASPLPPLSNGQDCGTFVAVCDTIMSYGNPGFQSFGNICDFSGNGANCLNAGERGSVWFSIDINANGILEFTIVPKDWTGPAMPIGNETDYDFAVWKITGIGGVTCADIASPNDAVPAKCNYSALGISGMYSGSNGVAPPQYPGGYGGAFESYLNVVAGERYAIVVSNWATSTSGFDIIFGNTSPIGYLGASSTSTTWSGGVDTDWYKKENWGGCAIPSCTRDAIVNGGIVLQPDISSGTANAKSVIINPGAALTLSPGRTLAVCENFTNLGSFKAGAGSTVLFNNNTFNQNIDGNLSGADAFDNVSITKSGGVVKIFNDVEMRGKFCITNGSSAFNANGKIHKVGGDFINFGTYLTGTGGTLELNGTAEQDYSNFATLNNLVVNNTGNLGIHLFSDLYVGNNGTLTLNSGVIHNSPFFEVQVFNRASNAISTGNDTSFIEGILRRYINSQGYYEYPVGTSSKGYQLASIDFNDAANPTINDNITGVFHEYGSLPAAPGTSDCGVPYNSPPLDNGYWTFFASNDPTSGNFDMILHNANYTNILGKWTIMSDDGSGYVIANGTCATSWVSYVHRTGMNNISLDFGTAQSPNVLPVELLSLTATSLTSSILLNWTTASEKENRGFEIQRSDGSGDFIPVGFINGSGNSSSMHSYSFEDRNVTVNKIYYYRLRQIDFDGNYRMSNVVSGQLHGRFIMASVFPNPVTDESILNYFLDEPSSVQINLINTLGEIVQVLKNEHEEKGQQYLILNPSKYGIASGLYTIRISANGNQEFLKVIFTGK